MSILTKIKEHQLTARIAKQSTVSSFLTTLFSEAANVGLNDGKRVTTDDEVIAVARKFIKNAQEIIHHAPDTEAAQWAEKEIDILTAYLPKQLSEEEMKTIIEKIEVKTVPNIMSYFKTHHLGTFCGKTLSSIAKAL